MLGWTLYPVKLTFLVENLTFTRYKNTLEFVSSIICPVKLTFLMKIYTFPSFLRQDMAVNVHRTELEPLRGKIDILDRKTKKLRGRIECVTFTMATL